VPAFPNKLAKVVFDRWNHLVAGDYTTPPCPPLKLLKQLMEICYLAAGSPEEARYPQFNVVAIPTDLASNRPQQKNEWHFASRRPLSIGEIRRLAPAVDLKKSAILAVWNEKNWGIVGLVDLGTSWYRARVGLEYVCNTPDSLLIQVDRPGRMRVFQGAFHIATLVDGDLQSSEPISFPLFLHQPVNAGLARMHELIDSPAYEHPREFLDFEFIALWNTFAAIANAISSAGHGGMLVITPGNRENISAYFRLKYSMSSLILKNSFIAFINARHVTGDHIALLEDGYWVPQDVLFKAEIIAKETYQALVEATRFVAGLSGCDGSIVISDDLTLLGFGGEIRADQSEGINVYEIESELNGNRKACDIEQFGMRHRSAIKLAGQDHDCRILAVSQDGPISGIWWEKKCVFVRKGVNLLNMNLPLA
jgi:hypothetical protein